MTLNPKSDKSLVGTVEVAASSGITWAAPDNGNIKVVEYAEGFLHKTVITVPSFSFATTNAAKAIGQKIYTFPAGWIIPVAASIEMVSTTGGTTAATAGEIGLGTVIGSGANATMGAVGATSENIMEGTTISNHVAATALSSNKANSGVAAFDHGAAVAWPLDGTSTNIPVHLNIASTFSSTDGCTVNSAEVTIIWAHLGDA